MDHSRARAEAAGSTDGLKGAELGTTPSVTELAVRELS